MNSLIAMVGQNVLGSLWTTSIGSFGFMVAIKPLVTKVMSGATVGEIILSPEAAATVASLTAIVSKDPHK